MMRGVASQKIELTFSVSRRLTAMCGGKAAGLISV